MIVTEIEDCGSGKRKVYLDGQPAFVLYRGELSGCHTVRSWMRFSGNASACAVFIF